MKLPNGYGSVVFLGNNRRRPWGIRKTVGYDDNGRQRYTYVDYYSTRQDAIAALADLNKAQISIDDINITFADVFEKWWEESGIDSKPKGTIQSHKAAFKNCAELHDLKMRKIKKSDIQAVINNCEAGLQTRSKIKTLCTHLFNYGIDNDIVSKNYAANCDTGSDDGKKVPHKLVPVNTAKKLMKYSDKDVADSITILLYTGMRIEELMEIQSCNVHLDERYMIGGNKTTSGKNRKIPIADKIYPIVAKRVNDGTNLFMPKGKVMNAHSFRYHLKKANSELGCSVLFHDCRHTFVTNLRNLGYDKVVAQKIIGHKGDDVTDDTYTHITLDDMLKAVNSLDSIYK